MKPVLETVLSCAIFGDTGLEWSGHSVSDLAADATVGMTAGGDSVETEFLVPHRYKPGGRDRPRRLYGRTCGIEPDPCVASARRRVTWSRNVGRRFFRGQARRHG